MRKKRMVPNCGSCKWNVVLGLDEHSRCLAIGNGIALMSHNTYECLALYEEKTYEQTEAT